MHADDLLRKKYSGLELLTLDFETYYGPRYNLDALKSSFLYVTDPRFHIHGIAIRHPDGRAEFRTDVGVAISELRELYGANFERVGLLCHNAYFDCLILRLKFEIVPAHIFDTMLLSRLLFGVRVGHSLREVADRLGLDPKGDLAFMKGVRNLDSEQLSALHAYASNDVAITWEAAVFMLPVAGFFPLELWVMEHAIRLFIDRPLAIDPGQFQRGMDDLDQALKCVLDACSLSLPQVRSAAFCKAFDAALAPTGRKAPRKLNEKGEPIYALSKEDPAFIDLRDDEDPYVRALVKAKLFAGSLASRQSRLRYLEAVFQRGQSLHVFLNYYAAGPGRFQGGDGFNVQNFQKRGADGEVSAEAIPAAMCAPPGQQFVQADAAQIEARILAWISGQSDLHDMFAQGIDVYSLFASNNLREEVRKPQPKDPPETAQRLSMLRQVGKQAVLGLGYRMGVERFLQTLGSKPDLAPLFASGVLSTEKVAKLVHGFRRQYSSIPEFWAGCDGAFWDAFKGREATCRGLTFYRDTSSVYIVLPSGRMLIYPDVAERPPTYEGFKFLDAHGREQVATRDRPSLVYAGGIELHGGVIAENIVQGIARDLLVHVIYALEREELPVVFHCHDSVTVLVPDDQVDQASARLIAAWRTSPPWAKGLVLDAETKSGRHMGEL